MRQELEREIGSLLIPDPVVVAGCDLKEVIARREVGEISPALAPGVLPVGFQSLHLISEAHLLRGDKTQGRVVNFNPVLPRLNPQGSFRRAARADGVAIHAHLLYDHWRGTPVEVDLLGIHRGQALASRKPEPPVGGLASRRLEPGGTLQCGQSVASA